jgi:DNA-binding NtrC family response regulator
VLQQRTVRPVGGHEELPVDVRVIAATNRDPREAVAQRKLREDLLYRLQVVPIEVPPLRARAGDARLLANHFLAELNRAANLSKTFSEEALERISRHDWPGNVRELYNVVQRAFIMAEGRVIGDPGILSTRASTPARDASIEVRVGDSLADVEQRLILHTVSRCRTQDEAARTLGVSNKTLYNKLRLYESQRRASAGGTPQTPTDDRSFPAPKF